MQTGIVAADECVNEFNALRMKRAYRYLIFKMNDEKTQIVVEHKGPRDSGFEEFKESIPKDEPRFAIIELKYMADSGVHQEKIFFVLYAPDLSKNTGDKFIFATSKEQFKKKVQPFNYEIQINDWEDLKEEDFILKIKK